MHHEKKRNNGALSFFSCINVFYCLTSLMRCERIIYHHNVILCLQNEALLILEAFLSQELKLVSAVNKIINVPCFDT